jgi:pilus assembly protein CpaB
VFVAQADIGVGDQVTAQALKLEQWPKDRVPVGAVVRIEDVEGRRARTRLYAGEPILESKLMGKGASGQGASASIPKGYRVVPVKVDLVSGGSSMILPGDRVDVMVHLVRDPGREIPETVTRTILQDIKVFAVDDLVEPEKDKSGTKSIVAKTISLLVTPEQAAEVMLASQLGAINLVMRSPEDDVQGTNAQARPVELFSNIAKADRDKESLEVPPDATDKTKGLLDYLNSSKEKTAENKATRSDESSPPRETWTMRMIKAGAVEEVTFELDDNRVTSASPFGPWKLTTPAGSLTGMRTVKEEAKSGAPAAQEATAPAAQDPPQPNDESKEKKSDRGSRSVDSGAQKAAN